MEQHSRAFLPLSYIPLFQQRQASARSLFGSKLSAELKKKDDLLASWLTDNHPSTQPPFSFSPRITLASLSGSCGRFTSDVASIEATDKVRTQHGFVHVPLPLSRYPTIHARLLGTEPANTQKKSAHLIRIGYQSSSARNHPLSRMIGGLEFILRNPQACAREGPSAKAQFPSTDCYRSIIV